MSPRAIQLHESDEGDLLHAGVPNVVVVDPRFDEYASLAASARLGRIKLHFRSSGAGGLALSRRMRVDAWLVAADLDDMAGADFVELLRGRVGESRMAIVAATPAGAALPQYVEDEAAADVTLTPPITMADVERLIAVPTEERGVVLSASVGAPQAMFSLPVGVSAAAITIAVLMLS